MSAKNIVEYRAFTATEMYTRSDIPDLADITENANDIDCTKVTVAKIKTALGVAVNKFSELCTHANINHWSGLSPTIRSISGGNLVNSDPASSYKTGSFAGYNHGAVTPHYESITHDDDVEVVAGATVHFTVEIDLGEAILTGTDISGCSEVDRGLALTVWDGVNILTRPDTSQVIDIEDIDIIGSSVVTLDTTFVIPAGTTTALQYTCKIYLSNDLTGFASDLTNAICKFTDLTDYTKLFKVLVANHFWLNGPENLSSATGATTFTSGKWEVNGAQCVRVSDTVLDFTLNYVQLNDNLSSGNYCVATVYVERGYYNGAGIWIGTILTTPVEIYDGIWNDSPNHLLAFSVVVEIDIWDIGSTIDSSGYGYRYAIDCDVTTV